MIPAKNSSDTIFNTKFNTWRRGLAWVLLYFPLIWIHWRNQYITASRLFLESSDVSLVLCFTQSLLGLESWPVYGHLGQLVRMLGRILRSHVRMPECDPSSGSWLQLPIKPWKVLVMTQVGFLSPTWKKKMEIPSSWLQLCTFRGGEWNGAWEFFLTDSHSSKVKTVC